MNELVSLPTLHFPTYPARIRSNTHTLEIYDDVRAQWVALTPEEWVRQNCLHWLLSRGFPKGRCSVERRLGRKGMRYDLLWLDAKLSPFLLVECKAPSIAVSTDTLRQSQWYNLTLRAPYVLLTNGLTTYCAAVDREGYVDILPDIPNYPSS